MLFEASLRRLFQDRARSGDFWYSRIKRLRGARFFVGPFPVFLPVRYCVSSWVAARFTSGEFSKLFDIANVLKIAPPYLPH